MRLALFTNQFPSKVNTFLARDVRGLLEAGIEVDIFPLYPLDAKLWSWVPEILGESVFPRDRVHYLSSRNHFCRTLSASVGRPIRFLTDTIKVCSSAISYGPGAFSKSLYACLLAPLCLEEVRGRYDHIFAYWGNYPATYAWMVNRLLPQKLPFSMILHAGTDLYRTQTFLQQKLLHADNIFVVCDFNRDFIANRFPDIYPTIANKVQKHHLGIDLEELPFNPGGRLPSTIIAVGRFDRRKGLDFLIRAAALVRKQCESVSFQLVGDGPEGPRLRKLTQELGLSDSVSFMGWRTFSEVRELIQSATILVHPSPEIGDAVPTVIKEAMALGTPVIGSRVAGIPELLDQGRCGVLVPPGEVKPLASAMLQLVQTPGTRQRFAVAARAQAERIFNLWTNTKRLASILHGQHPAGGACASAEFLRDTRNGLRPGS